MNKQIQLNWNWRIGRFRELHRMTNGISRAISGPLRRATTMFMAWKRVTGYASAIARRLDLNIPTVEVIKLAGFLHRHWENWHADKILLKPVALDRRWNRECFGLHRRARATTESSRMLPEMEDVVDVIKHHHEHYDGSGYPTD